MQRGKSLFIAVPLLVVSWLLLSIPGTRPPAPANPPSQPFAWNQDPLWFALEQRFRELRALGCDGIVRRVNTELSRGHRLLDAVDSGVWDPAAPLFDSIEANTFDLGPMIATCPTRLPDYVALVTRSRSVVKRQSERWDIAARSTRDRLYRLLYGGRAALEEVMLQDSVGSTPALVLGDDEPSKTPFTRILGVTIHSGDLLVSRGGAQMSALIAVGNDYQGNFSHVALVYVDERTSLASVIESRPKDGVAVHELSDYLRDVKLRVMVVRLRADLPALVADPMIPHRAAAFALTEAQSRRIPYDVAMNQKDHARMYCSEVLSAAYERLGIRLWMGTSNISSPGVASWLADMGVEYFETQVPSDLEYDPQVRVVAEWRDPETLFVDHVDNVITEGMLRGAQRGVRLEYPWYMLPLGRLVKVYSAAMQSLGLGGPIPPGMSADAALRVLSFNAAHTTIKRHVLTRATEFRQERGYIAPQWELLEFAIQALEQPVTLAAYLRALREQL